MLSPRLQREEKTVNLMINMYCQTHHNSSDENCEKCITLRNYARVRLEHCRYGDNKPTCSNCPIHCYRKSMASEIKKVMRFAGPRMMFKHPILAIKHVLDGKKKLN
jgi:hypothetical protein